MANDRLTFKEMCSNFEVTPRTLRYYEYIELLKPDREGRSRFYTPREVARMKLILRGRKWGFSLEDIRQWLDMYDNNSENATQMHALVDAANTQITELESRKEQIDEAISELTNLRDQVATNLSK
ncbi:MAG: MerR family DNA-binding transcriptional regulator [Litoreibacter sp.]